MTQDYSADVTTIGQIEAAPRILEVVCRTTGMGFAAIARVTEDRWIACEVRDDINFGLKPGGELKIETTICNEIRDSQQEVVIDHVAEDDDFRSHHTPAMYGFQSYISMPIMLPNGEFFGTLCAIDPRPMRLKTPETIGMFKLFADLLAFHIDAHRRLAASEANLLDARESAELREQFIAVLGHDLRNPLASIDAGAQMLLRTPLNEQATGVIRLMRSSVGRMAGMIDNVLDFARGRLGGGLTLERSAATPLAPMLEQVVAELRSARPHRSIETSFALTEAVNGDRVRIGQLLSNLVGNALIHGAPDGPIRVEATTADGVFELSVSNAGEPIPAQVQQKLFQPFVRSAANPSQPGLGLGLYIASEIARAHGGRLEVTSDAEATRFIFRMPIG